jgi:hypothetical protein
MIQTSNTPWLTPPSSRSTATGRAQRMARPVCKRWSRPGLGSLRQCIRSRGRPRPGSSSARPEPHKGAGIECHFARKAVGTPVDCQAISLPPASP